MFCNAQGPKDGHYQEIRTPKGTGVYFPMMPFFEGFTARKDLAVISR